MTHDLVTVTVAEGALRGVLSGGINTFLGVPYAAAPDGRLRFAVPAPVTPWRGTRDAFEPGPTAPQKANRTFAGLDMFSVTGAEWRTGGSYLTANVWAPASADRAPVMVYIHGGGLVLGSKDAPVYSGTRFARDGVVMVNLNYRLGADGFLPIPGAPANLGLRDILAGLRWVQRNIATFGGDPGNVTLFGESGGAIAVACLLTSPLSRGLFHRAAVQSGHGSAVYLLIGTTSEEARFWFGPTRMEYLPRPLARLLLRFMTPNASQLFSAYADAFPKQRGGVTLIRVLSDLSFRWPARQFAAAHQGRTYMYEFEWRSPAAGGRLGAAHGMELPFVFDTLDTVTGPGGFAGDNPPQPIADRAHRLWIDFATSGKLPWPLFDSETRHVYQIARGKSVNEAPLIAAAFLGPGR